MSQGQRSHQIEYTASKKGHFSASKKLRGSSKKIIFQMHADIFSISSAWKIVSRKQNLRRRPGVLYVAATMNEQYGGIDKWIEILMEFHPSDVRSSKKIKIHLKYISFEKHRSFGWRSNSQPM